MFPGAIKVAPGTFALPVERLLPPGALPVAPPEGGTYPENEPEVWPNWNDELVITGTPAEVVVTVALLWFRPGPLWVNPDVPVPLSESRYDPPV